MQGHRTCREPDALALRPAATPRLGTVRGLGISDVLLVELQPRQVAACVDEIDSLGRILEDAFAIGPNDDSDRQRYELRVLRAMRSVLLEQASLERPLLVGPAPLVSEVVARTAADIVAGLHESLSAIRGSDEASRDELLRRSEDTTAWMRTYVDALAVQWFSFDPDLDYLGP
jgi:hypothetical protein